MSKGLLRMGGKWYEVSNFELIPKKGCKCKDCQKARKLKKIK